VAVSYVQTGWSLEGYWTGKGYYCNLSRLIQGIQESSRFLGTFRLHYEIFSQFFYSSSYWISKILSNKQNQPVTQNSRTRVMARLGSLNNLRPGSIVLDAK
jgi:hypothetical protein